MCPSPPIGPSRPCDLIYLKDWFYWFTELMWCQFNQCAVELCRIWHLCELKWMSVQYWSGYPQYLFSYLSKSWLIQCVRNNVGMCLCGCSRDFVCVSLPLSPYICVTGNCICYRLKVSPFYWSSSVYNLYVFFTAHAKAHCCLYFFVFYKMTHQMLAQHMHVQR